MSFYSVTLCHGTFVPPPTPTLYAQCVKITCILQASVQCTICLVLFSCSTLEVALPFTVTVWYYCTTCTAIFVHGEYNVSAPDSENILSYSTFAGDLQVLNVRYRCISDVRWATEEHGINDWAKESLKKVCDHIQNMMAWGSPLWRWVCSRFHTSMHCTASVKFILKVLLHITIPYRCTTLNPTTT